RDTGRKEIDEWQTTQIGDIDTRASHDIGTARKHHDEEVSRSNREYQHARQELDRMWKDGLARIQAPIEGQEKNGSRLNRDWNDAGWNSWQPPTSFAPTIQFGELEVDVKEITENVPGQADSRLELPKTFSLPALLAFPSQASLLIQHDRDRRAEALQTLQMVMTRLLTTQPPGRVRFTI